MQKRRNKMAMHKKKGMAKGGRAKMMGGGMMKKKGRSKMMGGGMMKKKGMAKGGLVKGPYS
jgi:hypothetical protein